MKPPGKFYIPTSRGLVHAQERGDGEATLVILTVTSFGGVVLDAVLPALAERGWRVLALDLMGYGRSDKRNRVWLVEDFADNLLEALAAVDVVPDGLVCGHFSSWIGIEIARRAPPGLAGLMLDGTPYFAAERRATNLANPPAPPRSWDVEGSHALGYWKMAHGLLQKLDPDFVLPAVPDQRFRERYLALLEATMYEPGTMDAANRFDIDRALAALSLPVLLTCSDDDWNLPHQATLKAALPAAREHRFPGVHPLHDLTRGDRSAEYVACVDAFFRTVLP